jgi:hypothetical protein
VAVARGVGTARKGIPTALTAPKARVWGVIARPQKNREEMLLRTQYERFAEELAERFETWRAPERRAELRDAFADRGAAELPSSSGVSRRCFRGLSTRPKCPWASAPRWSSATRRTPR